MPPRHILPTIVLAQLAGTSLWFAGNAVMPDLTQAHDLAPEALAWSTSSVQLGFIVGTLVSAITTLTDRVPARAVFSAAATLGAAANLAPLVSPGLTPLLLSRLLVGVAMAGVYPVGMKLAASWYAGRLSQALGWLVGALVLGTATPHLIRGLGAGLPWTGVLVAVSALALLGGVAVAALVPEGPHAKRSAGFDPGALLRAFRAPTFRASALGYLGHMWELYAFWALAPMLAVAVGAPSSLGAFATIALGAVGCVVGGRLASRHGSARIAAIQLGVSGLLALSAPLWGAAPTPVALALLALWGVTVVGDSPQLSTLTARTAPPSLVGSALTLVTSLGFAITIVSIDLTQRYVAEHGALAIAPLLAIGPALGLIALRTAMRDDPTRP